MTPFPTFKLKIVATFWALLVCTLALRAAPPQGKVIWWGMEDINDPNKGGVYRDLTNGVVESDDEIASNIIAAAGHFSDGTALRSDGTVIQFGVFSSRIKVPPEANHIDFIAVPEPDESFWAARRDGTVMRWGLFVQSQTNFVAGLSNATAIVSAGPSSYLALRDDGTVTGMRFDTSMDYSAGFFRTNQARLVRVHGEILSNVTALASMGFTRVLLKTNGDVFMLRNQTPEAPPSVPGAELGGESRNIPFDYAAADPVMIDGAPLTNVSAISAGGLHAVALKKDGTVVTWPDPIEGNRVPLIPPPAGLSNVTAISASQGLDMALKQDGTVVEWGDKEYLKTPVPAGLSNVVQIAAASWFGMAITTGAIPASVFITPHGRLERMARKADLIFKGQALSSERITNAAFTISSMELARTKFKVISVLQGDYANPFLDFEHYSGWTSGPHSWGGAHWPAFYQFEPGHSYIVYAANLGRKDEYSYYYQSASNTTNKPNEFREIADAPNQDDDGVIRALDARPVETGSLREAAWTELNLLLNDPDPTNQLYAIRHMDWMSDLCNAQWGHSKDFKRPRVLKALQPSITSTNDKVAIAALRCFPVGAECATQLFAYVPDLVRVADNSAYSVPRRVAAIAAFSGTSFPELTNSLPGWLGDPSEHVRATAVLLLPDFPGQFSESALRERATDPSPHVRGRVADAIGNGKIQPLLPTLETLLKDPVGLTTPPPRVGAEEYESGIGPGDGTYGNVHAAAANALLKFDVDQVSGILKSNLNDPQFRPEFLCKLAEKDPAPWLPDLAEVMETRRARIQKQADEAHVEPKEYYFEALMSLSGTYFHCWNIIHDYLTTLPSAGFSNGKMDRYLNVLETAGNTGSQEPVKLYELYRTKGLNERARQFRATADKKFAGYRIDQLFNQADARITNSPTR